MQVKRILCPVDFSDFSVKAYDYAQSLAGRYRAELYVLNVQHWNEILSDEPCLSWAPATALCELNDAFLQEIQKHLQKFVEIHTHIGIRPTSLVREGDAADHILFFARDQKVDLVVMGTHGRRGLDRLMLGSVTERVLRNAPCRVLVVRKPTHDFIVPENTGSPVLLHRILCCTDFSSPSEKAMKHALFLSEEYEAELTLVHVLEDTPYGITAEEQTAKATQHLEQLLSPGLPRKCAVKTAVLTGRAYEQIIRLASETDTDLTVMGVRGRNALDVAVFGSTTYRVIQLGSCPVLVVHA